MEALIELLGADFLGKPAWLWLAFLGVVVLLLALDLGLLHRDDHAIEARESLALSAGYIALGLGFGAWVWWYLGPQSGMEYLTGFVIEKTLSMDNVFVIAMIFTFFAVPPKYQYRVLFWGVLGVIVLRGLLIGAGAALVHRFDWILYLFGAFLLATGVKMLLTMQQEMDLSRNWLLRLLRRHLRVTEQPHGHHFFVRLPAGGAPGAPRVWWVTPLFLALMMVEAVDLVFAVDSVPAIFAITQDPFIVYTSNIFAILGLRALYFALAAMIERFRYLKYALALVLVFVGGKIIGTQLVGKMPAWLSLAITFALLAGGVLYSLYRTRGSAPPSMPPSSHPLESRP